MSSSVTDVYLMRLLHIYFNLFDKIDVMSLAACTDFASLSPSDASMPELLGFAA